MESKFEINGRSFRFIVVNTHVYLFDDSEKYDDYMNDIIDNLLEEIRSDVENKLLIKKLRNVEEAKNEIDRRLSLISFDSLKAFVNKNEKIVSNKKNDDSNMIPLYIIIFMTIVCSINIISNFL